MLLLPVLIPCHRKDLKSHPLRPAPVSEETGVYSQPGRQGQVTHRPRPAEAPPELQDRQAAGTVSTRGPPAALGGRDAACPY